MLDRCVHVCYVDALCVAVSSCSERGGVGGRRLPTCRFYYKIKIAVYSTEYNYMDNDVEGSLRYFGDPSRQTKPNVPVSYRTRYIPVELYTVPGTVPVHRPSPREMRCDGRFVEAWRKKSLARVPIEAKPSEGPAPATTASQHSERQKTASIRVTACPWWSPS